MSIGGGEDSLNLTAALRDIYTTMDKGSTIPPIVLLQVLHMAFPRFAERGENGGYQQQDANECWMEVLRMLQVGKTTYIFNLKIKKYFSQAKTSPTENSVKSNAIDQFLGIECSSETRCNEVSSDRFYFEEVCNINLTFHISGT